MIAICLITLQPNKIWCDFLNTFNNYKIFIVIDDIDFDVTDFKNTYTNIDFITIENQTCQLNGYIDINFTLNKLITGWEKALYYFGIKNINYDFVWFIEDDVYFYDENTIINIDKQYTKADLLSNRCDININGNKNYWHWNCINIKYSPPYYNGMMCAVRLSKNMLNCINNYAKLHKTLFFLEALLPTIGIKNNLKCAIIEELSEIHYRHDFEKNNINTKYIYHPVKNLNKHIYFRE
jgi:hypothetical protein